MASGRSTLYEGVCNRCGEVVRLRLSKVTVKAAESCRCGWPEVRCERLDWDGRECGGYALLEEVR